MEIPIQVAVRLKPPSVEDSSQCIFSNPVTQTVLTESGQTFQVNRALPVDCTQAYLYSSIMPPQVGCFLDGCDTSVVLFGQSGTGKTYTLFGQGFECIHSESDQGIIPRFITDIFHKLSQMPERDFAVHLTWVQLVQGRVFDVLGSGLVKCNNIEEAFQYLQLGWRSQTHDINHTVFTVSIEQKWIGANGILNHRQSTASFYELAAYPEPSLFPLENVIKSLLDPSSARFINYDQSILTAMLRDSFGGRAFTWVLGCLSTDPKDIRDNLRILDICWCCRGVRNFVTINAFADNNTPIISEKGVNNGTDNNIAMQFATEQWIKLVSNAEGLFNKILQTKTLNDTESNQISEWLFLKAECDECLNPEVPANEIKENVAKQGLPRIAEDTEPSEPTESDVESDGEDSQLDTIFQDKLDKYMLYFREKNDELILNRCEEYLRNAAVDNVTLSETSGSQSLPVMTSVSHSGRRKTIQPGESISGSELELLRRAAAKAISPESQKIIIDSRKNDQDPEPKLIQRELLKLIDSPMPNEQNKKYKIIQEKYNQKQMLARKLSKEIDSSQIQLKELINLCIAKERLIDELSKLVRHQHSSKRHSDWAALKSEYEKAKLDLAVAQGKLSNDKNNVKLTQQIQKWKSVIDHYERHDSDSDVLGCFEHDTNKEIRKHENKLKAYRKQVDQIKRQIKKDEKRKNTLDVELVKDKMKMEEFHDKDLSTFEGKVKDKKVSSLKHVKSRITHLDSILKEKSTDLQRSELTDEKEVMLRREIKNLRRTRECLLDQRCSLGNKRKVYKSLSDSEERKLLECEEAIEAIDTAIEFKNALICGHSPSASLSDSQYGDRNGDNPTSRGEQMLMARLDKLSHDEMKTLLYKYFQKVVDLRGACSALEAAAGAAAAEAGTWRARCAAAARQLQAARAHAGRRTATLATRHYQALQRLDDESGSERSAFMMTTDSETSDDAMRLVHKMKQLPLYNHSCIPSQNLKQLMPATSAPTTKVTRQKNKLVIVQENKALR